MKILLINAADETEMMHTNNPFMPLALPLLAASAPGQEYNIVDLLAEENFSYDEKTDLVGISARYTAQDRAFRISDEFRKRNIPVVLGGPQISANPFEAIKHADSVVVGEGEQLWPVLLKDIENRNLKNFYVCSPQDFNAENYTKYQITEYMDLKDAPVPARHLVKPKYSFDSVYASRGCSTGCDFCYVPVHFGRKFRLRPADDVVSEIKSFKRRYYYLIDDTVFGKESTYNYYIELYDKISRLKKKRYWTGQTNLDAAASEKGREVIRKARQAGLLYAAAGIESINPLTLEKSGSIRKTGAKDSEEVIDKIKENIRFIQDLGIIISGWFVLGYEDDTIDTYYKTYEFCKEMNILPAIFPVNALPGTKLYERIKKHGRLKNSRFSNISHPNINDDDIEKALIYIISDGYSAGSNIKRIRFYLKRFGGDKIHKSIFLAVLNSKLKKGLDPTLPVQKSSFSEQV